MSREKSVPSVSVTYAQTGRSTQSNELGMRPMQERAYEKRGEQYLLIKSPPASGKSRALMFIALDKLHNQGLKQAIIVVPEKSIGASFNDEPLSEFGFWADWTRRAQMEPVQRARHRRRQGQTRSEAFLDSGDQRAGLHARHLPLCCGQVRDRGVRRPADRRGRVPPCLAPTPTTSLARIWLSLSPATRCILWP
ncbi:MAG: DEAD/DEAH box helicase family protein [Halofilum sp. (in: g-proteobacteria)]|nr:DEAD/DEAH box helicase family protein [Halofilum sp. (in: g-proteobacteria)]